MRAQPGSSEWEYTYQQMVFGQLGSFALNMRSFGLAPMKVTRIVSHLAVGNRLPAEMLQVRADLTVTIHCVL